MKKLLSLFFALITAMSALLSVPANAAYYNDYIENGFYSETFILLCTDNNEVLFAKDQNKQMKPASLTKIVTASVILGAVDDLKQTVTISQSCIDELAGTGSSVGGLQAGETYTVYDLLCCLLIESANDAATVLANFLTGDDRAAFVDKMNALAAKLGCDNSNFVNVHGLDDDDQYTTASDIAKFLENAMKYPAFAEISSMISYELPATELRDARTIRTTNYTLVSAYADYYCKYINGGKTGYTSTAGHCLAVSAANNGYNYIAVAMNAPKEDIDADGYDENGAFMDCREMLDWAFENLRLVSIADAAKIVTEIPVKFAKGTDYVTLCPSDTAFSLMPEGIDAGSLLVRAVESSVPKSLNAPIKKGDVICKGEVLYADEVIAEIDLVASSTVKRSFISYFGTKAVDLFSKPAVKLISVAVVAAFIVLMILRRRGIIKARRQSIKVLNYNDFFENNNNNKNK